MVQGTDRLLLAMTAVLACASCAYGSRSLADVGATRRYYIAANTVVWNYTPSGLNQCQGREFTPEESVYARGGNSSTYLKAQYQAYSDATFKHKLARPAEEAHLGIMGPLMRAVVGDVVEVHLRNNLDFPVNMVPQGVTYSAHQAGKVAAPGQTVVYAWRVPEQAGPTPESNSTSAMWLYRSLVDQQAHADAGLFGPLIVTSAADADPTTAKPKGVDAEFVTVFQVVDEASSPFAEANAKRFGGPGGQDGIANPDDFAESQMKHTINGRMFCNLEGLKSAVNKRVRWHTSVQGNEVDVHNAHWHGIVFNQDGTNTDQFNVLPSKTWTGEMITDNPGAWLLHCHVNDHFTAGMQALFTLDGDKQTPFEFSGVERTFYVQSEENAWNYAQTGGNMCSGRKTPFDEAALVFLGKSPARIGPVNIKARYVEYTDASFKHIRVRTEAEQHLGLLGPAIRAEVGDKVKIVFRNTCRFPTTIHVHGLRYNKTSEGAGYADGTAGAAKGDDGVPTGGTHIYNYHVPERAGPGPKEPSSKLWMYHSHADEAADTYAGLMGPIIISRRGASRPDGTPADVDREFVLFFSVMDESASSLFVANLNTYLGKEFVGAKGVPEVRLGTQAHGDNGDEGRAPMSAVDAAAAAKLPKLAELLATDDFGESNLKHSINGFMFCNMPGLEARVGQRVRFYVMALGNEVDLHTPSLESASLDWQGKNQNAMMLLPGNMETADVQLTAEGRWIFQCRVADHISAGMRAMFLAHPADGHSLAPAEVTSRNLDPTPQVDAAPKVALQSSQQAPKSLLAVNQPQSSNGVNDATPKNTLPGSSAADSAAIYSTGRSSSANGSSFSRLAAGLSLTPLKDLAFAAGNALRTALFGGTKSLPSLADVAAKTAKGAPIATPVARTYYIQAQEQIWNYAPHGLNRCTGEKFADQSALYTTRMNNTLGPRAVKALYRAYTDDTFTTPLPHDAKLGILGPLIQAQVGDTIRIVFRNALPFGANLFLGGALIPQDSLKAIAAVDPGVTFDYLWQVPEEAGPQADDPSSVHYPYFSTVDYVTDQYSGLMGVVMVARQGTLTAQGTIAGIDLVQPLLFQVWNEGASAYLTKNVAKYNPLVDTSNPDFEEGNLKHSINGYLYCNMPDIYVKQGRTIRFMQVASGTENDMHAPVFNNQVLTHDHTHTATTMLFPGITRTADMMAASAPGIFQYRCDYQDHYLAGMQARLVVTA